MTSSAIVSKIWSFCNTLRDDGVSYGDYLEQLTYLLFLKMADEYSKPPYNRKLTVPAEYNWESLTALGGDGGVIAVAPDGTLAWSFNTSGMYRAQVAEGQKPIVAIFKGEP